MPVYNLGYKSATCLLTNNVGDYSWITNLSKFTLYLNSDANVNSVNYDYVLGPSASVQWQANNFCYGIFDGLNTGAVQVSSQMVSLQNYAGITSGSSSAFDILYSGNCGNSNFIYVQPYQSVRVRVFPNPLAPYYPRNTPGPVISSAGAFPLNQWAFQWTSTTYRLPPNTNYITNYESLEVFNVTDNVYANNLYDTSWGYEFILDVKGTYFSIWSTPDSASDYSAYWSVEIAGFSMRKPQLYYEKVFPSYTVACDDNSGDTYVNPIFFNFPNALKTFTLKPTAVIPLATASVGFRLPAYSGTSTITVNEDYNVVPTTKGRWSVLPEHQGELATARLLPTTVWTNDTTKFTGTISITGIRDNLIVYYVAGTGYGNILPTITVTQYGSEEQ